MDYRCPHCSRMLSVGKLFFSDISSCRHCGQRVALGDFFAFAMSAFALLVSALTAMYELTQRLHDPFVAGGYAVAIGMSVGIGVLLLLGRAKPYSTRRFKLRVRRRAPGLTAAGPQS